MVLVISRGPSGRSSHFPRVQDHASRRRPDRVAWMHWGRHLDPIRTHPPAKRIQIPHPQARLRTSVSHEETSGETTWSPTERPRASRRARRARFDRVPRWMPSFESRRERARLPAVNSASGLLAKSLQLVSPGGAHHGASLGGH